MTSDRLILVIHQSEDRGRSLKEQIEFMDAPRVEVASPAAWRDRLGASRLAAVFISRDVAPPDRDRVISDIGELDPNTPIVMVAGEVGQGEGNA